MSLFRRVVLGVIIVASPVRGQEKPSGWLPAALNALTAVIEKLPSVECWWEHSDKKKRDLMLESLGRLRRSDVQILHEKKRLAGRIDAYLDQKSRQPEDWQSILSDTRSLERSVEAFLKEMDKADPAEFVATPEFKEFSNRLHDKRDALEKLKTTQAPAAPADEKELRKLAEQFRNLQKGLDKTDDALAGFIRDHQENWPCHK